MNSAKPQRRSLPRITVPASVASLWTLALPLIVVWLFSVFGASLSKSASIDLGYALSNLIIVVAMWT